MDGGHLVREALNLGARPYCPRHGVEQRQGVKDPSLWGHLAHDEQRGDYWCVGPVGGTEKEKADA